MAKPLVLLALLLGLLNMAAGGLMIISPHHWYLTTPGVTGTGPFNHHFVIDIGLAFLASGGFWFACVTTPKWRGPLAIAAASWTGLHGLFHVILWFTRGPLSGVDVIIADIVGVIGLSALGVGVAVLFARQSTNA